MNLTIDGRQVAAEPGTSILAAARAAGIDIPTLCQDDRLEPFTACRLCLVEVEGARALLAACGTDVSDGMVVRTSTPEIDEERVVLLDLLLSDHRNDCIICDQAGGCRLQEMAYRFGISTTSYAGEVRDYPAREDTPFIAYDPAKCILCGRCVGICQEVQGCHVLDFARRGFDSLITTSFGRSMVETECEMCGNCVSACPTGALQDKLSRFACRTWEATPVDTVCPFCGCGCNIQLFVKDGRGGQGLVAGRQGTRRRQPLRQGPLRVPVHQPPGPSDTAAGAPATASSCRRPGTRRSTWWPALRRDPRRGRRRRADGLLVGALHQRGELPLPEVHARGDRHATTSTTAPASATPPRSAGLAPVARQRRHDQLVRRPRRGRGDAHHRLQHQRGTPDRGAAHQAGAAASGAKLIVADPRRIDMARRADLHLQLPPGHQRRRCSTASCT